MEDIAEQLIGASKEDVIKRFGKPDINHNGEMVYTLKIYFFGLYKKKLYFFFYKEHLQDYYIGL